MGAKRKGEGTRRALVVVGQQIGGDTNWDLPKEKGKNHACFVVIPD